MNSAAATTDVGLSEPSHKSSGKSNQKQPVDLEELVSNTTQQRNWRGIVIALLVIVSVLGLIVTAVVLVTPKTVDQVEKAKLSFKEFITHEYEPRVFRPIMLPGGEKMIHMNHNSEVEEVDFSTYNTSKVIMDNSTFRELNTDQFRLSADENYVLLPYDIHSKYRHSIISKFKVYNVNTKTLSDFIGPLGEEFDYVTWSPKGSSVVCVQYNDIFYLKDIETDHFQRLTFDGELDQIYNGIPDWVYEEEILSNDNAIWWSPEGTSILFATFDETEVYRFDMAFYGDMTDYYVENRRIPYPKAGTPNPKVTLKIFSFNTNATITLKPPKEFANEDHYFTTVSWQNDTSVLISWLNRPQNVSILTLCSAVTGKCRSNHRVEGDGGWVDIYAPAMFTPDGNSYFLILSQKDGQAGSFKHVAKVDANTDISLGGLVLSRVFQKKHVDGSKIFLTAGTWDVTKIVGYDDDLKKIYFIATKMGDPRMRHLYSTTTSKDDKHFRKVTCLSCDISDDCQYVEAIFTPTGKYYVLACKGPGVPSYHLYSIDGGFLKTLEDNKALKDKLSGMDLPKTEYIEIPLSDQEYMWAKVLLPPVLKKEEIITYEILFRVYGSPGSQKVTEEYNVGWEHYLSSVHGVIIAYVDGRGSGGRGDRWLHANYKNLGTTEVEDTLTAGRYFNALHYVNDQSSTIWGLSYGGFLTASILGRGDGVFKCGVAVAPVTDWRYYDSVYTERYMGLPTAADNLDAYNFSNVSRHAAKFKSSRFMLIHGTGDEDLLVCSIFCNSGYKKDNVHFQNSAQFMKALTENNVYFQSQIYTDESHWLNGGNTQTHLYNSMEDFLLSCYGKSRPQTEVDDEVVKDAEEIEER